MATTSKGKPHEYDGYETHIMSSHRPVLKRMGMVNKKRNDDRPLAPVEVPYFVFGFDDADTIKESDRIVRRIRRYEKRKR